MNTPYWSLPTPNIDALIKHKKGNQMTDKKLAPQSWLIEDLITTILDASPKELPRLHNKLTALAGSINLNDLLKQERNKALDLVEKEVIGEDIPEGTAWDRNRAGDRQAINIILVTQREAIKKIKEGLING